MAEPITRSYLRKRTALTLGILLAAFLASLFVAYSGREEHTRRSMNSSALDSTLVAVAQLTLDFNALAHTTGPQEASNRRGELRRMLRLVTEGRGMLAETSAAGTLAPETARILSHPALDPVGRLHEIATISDQLLRTDATSARVAQLAWAGHDRSRELLPILLRMKETERENHVQAGRRLLIYAAGSLLIIAVGILVAFQFVHRPMERFILSAQMQIEDGRRQAVAASTAKSTFLATMSHEIRTPLNGVLGLAEALQQTELSSEQREMLDMIVTSGSTLVTLIGDVLDLSKIEAGQYEIEQEPVDFAAICREVVGLFAGSAKTKGIGLSLSIAPDGVDWRGTADGKAVRQILTNLIGNSIKFTEIGSVTLGLSLQEGGAQGERHAVLTVRDDGIGIAPEQHHRIFERFEQVDASTSRQYGGTGLGLAIVRHLTHAMDGEVTLESAPGEGATFSVRLPMGAPLAPTEAFRMELLPTESATVQPTRVLVVDDNRVNQLITKKILQNAGCRIEIASNGVEAVAVAARSSPDLILMDSSMPVMDGLTATRLIRQAEKERERPRTPIYGLSAHALPEYRAAACAAGMDGYLTKPLRAAELRSVLGLDRTQPNTFGKCEET